MADKVKIIFKSGQTNSPAQQTDGAYTVPLSDGQVLFYYNKDASTGDVYSAGEIYYDKLVDGTVKRMKMGAIADRATYDKSGTDIEDYVFNLNFTVGTNNIVITPVSGAGKNKAAVTIPGATAALAGVVTTGAQSFAGAKTFNGVVHVNNATAVALNNTHGLAVGVLNASNLGFDGAHIQARNNGAASTLNLNSLGGQVVIGSGGLKVDGPAIFTKAITDKNGKELLADLFVNRLVGALSNSDYKINWYNTANARMSTDLTQLIIPAATASAAGLVSILDQIFKGNKTFSDNITANANIYVDTSGKGLWLKDSTNTRYGAVVDSANNLWIGSSTCGDRAHVGQLFLSTGFQDSSLSSAYPTVLISKPKKNADGTFDHDKYYVIHSGNFVEYDQYVKDIQWINGTTLGPKAKLIYKLNGVTQETTTTIPAATAALAGVVTTGAQSFAGAKTFTSNTTISGTLTMGNNIIFPWAYGVYWNGAQKFKIVAKYGASSTEGYLCIQGTSSLVDYIKIREDGQVQILNSANTELLDKNSQILRANLFLAKLELATTGTTNVITAKNTANGVLSTITLNGATTGAAGLVTIGDQTWNGRKTLNNTLFINANSTGTGTTAQIQGIMASSDQWRIASGATASDAGYLEIATSDNGNEPIYVRQYNNGAFNTILRTLTLLDGSGNTSIPGALTVNGAVTFNGALVGKSTATFSGRVTAPDFLWTNPKTINGTAFDGTSNITTNYWGTARTLSLGNDATGSISINGSTNVTLNTTVRHITSVGRRTETASGTTANAANTGLAYSNGLYMSSTYTDPNTPVNYGNIITVHEGGSGQLLLEWSGNDSTTGHLYYRSHRDTSTGGWGQWYTIIDSNNYNNYSPTKVGGGASGTWNINITGNANTANIANYSKMVEERSFSNTNFYTYLENIANLPVNRTIFFRNFCNNIDNGTATTATYNAPCVDTHSMALAIGNYIRIISFDIRTNDVYVNAQINKVWNGWRKLLDSINYTNYTVTKTGGGASGTWNISISGNAATATTATRLSTSNVGSNTRPVYFVNGIPVITSYTLGTNVFCRTINSNFSTQFRTQTFGSSAGGDYIANIRNDTANVAYSPQHGSGIAWGRGDTHGYLFMNYSSPEVYVGGGNADRLNWMRRLPTATGEGANGTWPISITGNAGSANWTKYAMGLDEARYTDTNIDTFVQTAANVHPYGRTNEIRFIRFYANSPATYKLPVVDAHYLMMSIDNAINYTRIISFDIRTNDIYVGGRTNAAWQNWDKLLSSANYTQYTVTKTGGGASGTWGININGNANTATTATNANYLISRGVVNPQTGRTQAYGNVYSYNTMANNTGQPEIYMSIIGFGRGTGGTVEIGGCWTSGGSLWFRALRDTTDNWYAWKKVYTEANIIYSSGEPAGKKGDIWLKPVTP